MKYLLAFALLMTVISGYAQPALSWVKTIGSSGNEAGRIMVKDAVGNLYICGTFQNTIDFDHGPAVFFMTAVGILDTYVIKLDVAGNFLWAKNISGNSISIPMSIKLDASGNINIGGYFSGTSDFDPGPGEFPMTSLGNNDVFVMKLNENGNFLWAKRIGADLEDNITSMALDQDDNIILAGGFGSTVDFDPGPGVIEQVAAGTNRFAFILKLNAAGEYVWVTTISTTFTASAGAVAIDAFGNIFITGMFGGEADFDPGPGENKYTSNGLFDSYLLKMNSSGNVQWVKVLNLLNTDLANCIAVNAAGDIYFGGYFSQSGDFDPGPGTYNMSTKNFSADAYLCKFDAAGNFIWARSFGGSETDVCEKLTLDNAGNVYAAGTFRSQLMDMDPGSGIFELSSAGAEDFFIVKLDPSGNFIWAQQIGGPGQQMILDLLVTGVDNIYVAGVHSNTTDFDPGPGTSYLTAVGQQDGFFLHLKSSSSLPLTLLQFQAVNNKNNVLLQWKTEQEMHVSHFDIERSDDGKNFITIGKVDANNLTHTNQYSFSDVSPVTGTAYYRLRMVDMDATVSYSRIVTVKRNDNTLSLQLFPNPVQNKLYVQAPESGNAIVHITDVAGKLMLQQSVTMETNVSFSIYVQHLAPGKYYLILNGKKSKRTAGFVKQR